MKFGDQEWRRCGESDERQIEEKEERARRGKEEKEKDKSAVDEDKEGVAVEVEDEVKTVRPKRKQGGGQSTVTGVRRQLRRPVLPLGGGGGVLGKATSSVVDSVRAEQLKNPTANLADSFNRGLKVGTEESTVTAPANKVKYIVTDSPAKMEEEMIDSHSVVNISNSPAHVEEQVTGPPAKVEEPWEPLWMRQMKESGASLNLMQTPYYPQKRGEEPVGRAIWSPPKGSEVRVRGRGRSAGEGRGCPPLRWTPTGDSLLSL